MSSQPGRSRRKAAPPPTGKSDAAKRSAQNPTSQLPPDDQPPAQKPADRHGKAVAGVAGISVTPGSVVLVIGALLVLLSFTVLPWFGSVPGFASLARGHWHFADVHNVIDQLKAQFRGYERYVSFGLADVLFGWRGWLIFAAAVAFGALAVSPIGSRHWYLKWLAAVIAFTGAAISFFGLDLFTVEGKPPKNAQPPSFGEYVSHAGLGAWSAIVGFLLIVIAVFLPRRNREETS